MVSDNLNPDSVSSSELPLPMTMALVFLPWLSVVLFTAGGWASLNFIVYVICVIAVGYGIIRAALPASASTGVFVLAPAAGVMTVSALTAFGVRLGLPLIWVPALWLGLMMAGALCLWKDRAQWAKSTVAYGRSLALFSVLICGVFFLPGARNDAIQRPDGSFNWIYVDTQYFHSMAASIKSSDGPPRDPGTATEELLYHFGPYAPAAAISRLDGLNLGDAFARVTRGASLWALVLSCFGLGTLLSLKATAAKFGGIASVAGLFFYGSLSSLFTDERVSSSHVTGAILFTIPNVAVTADGGPFSHLILGHSVLHGLIAITAVMGLGVVQRELGADLTWRRFLLLAMPALAVPMHSVAALYCFGVVCILLFWGHLKRIQSWLLIMLSACLFLGAWKIMGSGHSADATLTTINPDLGKYWWTVYSLVAGLGFRIIGFRWISKPWKDPSQFSSLPVSSACCHLPSCFNFRARKNVMACIFYEAFQHFRLLPVTSGFWRSAARARWAVEWLGLTSKDVLFLIAYAVLMGIANRITRSHAWISYTRTEYISILLLGLVAVGTFALAKHSLRFAMVGSAILMGVLSIGFLAWVTPWLNYGQGRMKMDVTLSPGEVQGLDNSTTSPRPKIILQLTNMR